MPTDANSAAAVTKPTTLLRIVLLSIISVEDRLQRHRSGFHFPVQLPKSCNYTVTLLPGILTRSYFFYPNLEFWAPTPRGGSRRKEHSRSRCYCTTSELNDRVAVVSHGRQATDRADRRVG